MLRSIIEENFPSRYEIGQRVIVDFGLAGKLDNAYIRTAIFTNGKVRYSIKLYTDLADLTAGVEESGTTIHNVDSFFVKDYPGEPEFIEFSELDNYS